MKIISIEVHNFRKLNNIELKLDDLVTLIVGRNNSGKTSLSELFIRFLDSSKNQFQFNDFSFICHQEYIEAYNLYTQALQEKDEDNNENYQIKLNEAKNKIPSIDMKIFLEYGEEDDDDLGGFEDLNIVLEDSRRDISIHCNFDILNKEAFLEFLHKEVSTQEEIENNKIIDLVESGYRNFYSIQFYSFDKEDPNNKVSVSKNQIENAFVLNIISAQRDLDEYTTDKKGRIAKSMTEFLDISECLETSLEQLTQKLDEFSNEIETQHYNDIYTPILNDFRLFGIKEDDSRLIIKAVFDAKSILKNHSNFYYDVNGRNLPESHNGLGYSNLIYIALKIAIYCHQFTRKIPRSLSHLLFLEEPEAHLHPQMQMVFIKQIKGFIESKDWNVQIVLSTHSSQILSDCDFNTIRYFDSSSNYTNVKDIQEFVIQQNIDHSLNNKRPNSVSFLQKYMSLGNCNLFFADKAIMVEGITERIILPRLIQDDNVLSSQYISLMEVGGASAHIFKNLIEFINLKTLIITDIDSVIATLKPDKNGVERISYPACPTSMQNSVTSNAVLKSWIPQKENITDLLSCSENDKIDGKFKVAYQIPERLGQKCGRSFEEAFFLANSSILENYTSGLILGDLFKEMSKEDIENESYEITQDTKVSKNKSSIALDILSLENKIIPQYILAGLNWLKEN